MLLRLGGGALLALLAGCSDGSNNNSNNEIEQTKPVESSDLRFKIANEESINLTDLWIGELTKGQVPLDISCEYKLKNGEFEAFDDPTRDFWIYAATVTVLSKEEVKIGPFILKEGNIFAFYDPAKNVLNPYALVKEIDSETVVLIGSEYNCPEEVLN